MAAFEHFQVCFDGEMPSLTILCRLRKQQISYRAIDKAQIVIELFIQIKFLALTLSEI